MIKDLLRFLAADKSWPEAAEHFHCSVEVLASMFEQLERGGYIVRGSESGRGLCSSAACKACIYKKVCETKSNINFWTLTEKGRRAAAASSAKVNETDRSD
ncbi:MAG: hypothetical protein ACI38Q_02685 [Candidatus Bruticola sp.]